MARREMSSKDLLDQLYRGLDTVPAVEAELDAHELLGLGPTREEAPPPKKAVPRAAARTNRVRSPLLVVCGIAVAGTIAAAVLHQSEPDFSPSALVVDLPPPSPLPIESVSLAPATPAVVLTNPFDPSEKFTFPPGTSRAEAREQMANLLLERAVGRKAHLSRAPKGRKFASDPHAAASGRGS